MRVGLIAALALLSLPSAAQSVDSAAGRDKYAPCATCHGADGRSNVVPQYPKIGGQHAEYLVNALKAYRDGRRQGTYASIMREAAKQLSDSDIEQLAAYIESLSP